MAKEKVICDTDVLIDFWDAKSKRHNETLDLINNNIGLDNVYISAITQMELLMGAFNKIEENKIKKSLQRINIALINNEITIVAQHLFEKYRLSHGLAIPDCFIAATSIVTDLKLLTYNTKDYKFISELNLFDIKKV